MDFVSTLASIISKIQGNNVIDSPGNLRSRYSVFEQTFAFYYHRHPAIHTRGSDHDDGNAHLCTACRRYPGRLRQVPACGQDTRALHTLPPRLLPHSRIAIALESLLQRIQVLYPSWKAVELELILQGMHQY